MTKRKYTFEQRLEVVMHYFATDVWLSDHICPL